MMHSRVTYRALSNPACIVSDSRAGPSAQVTAALELLRSLIGVGYSSNHLQVCRHRVKSEAGIAVETVICL